MNEDYSSDEENSGFHFKPYNDEVIEKYLIPKLNNKPCGDFIVMKDLYAMEPWLLDHSKDPFFNEDEWYYFTMRTPVSDKKIGCGYNAKRKITGEDGVDRGYWRATKKKNIIDEKTGNIIGAKQSLTFMKSNNDKKKKKQQKIGYGDCVSPFVDGSQDSWIMKEFTLPDNGYFQELVICKIRRKRASKNKIVRHQKASTSHHQEASTSTYHHHEASTSTSHHHEASTSTYHHHEASTSTFYNNHQVASSSSDQHELDSLVEKIPENSSEKDEEIDWDRFLEECFENTQAEGSSE